MGRVGIRARRHTSSTLRRIADTLLGKLGRYRVFRLCLDADRTGPHPASAAAVWMHHRGFIGPVGPAPAIHDGLRRQAGEPDAAKARRLSVPSFPRELHNTL
jgi:hypothetical protein